MPTDPLFDRLAHALAGRYAMVRELGQGGMATVYLATDVKLGRRVALKVLPPTTRAYLGSGRFQREVLLAAQLSHPHIVPLFEADEVDGILFYVMEYVEGESLKDRLAREGPLPLDEAIRIAAEVGDALQYAHESGVIHRDVKPGNILLSRGHAMVSDFGIAKLMEESGAAGRSSLTGTGITVGTAEYMSPEQASGEQRLDARSDTYALAAVLYEMLAGEPPFTGPSVQAIVARVLSDPPRPLHTIRPGLPPHVERALAAGLAKLPADRPQSVRAFVTLLMHPSARRRIPARHVLGGALGTVVVVAVVVWMVGRRQPRPPPGMVLVPAGVYRVGGGPGAPGRQAGTARLEPFFIDSTEVTVGSYKSFLDATHGAPPWTPKPPDQWPVTGVLWSEALAYCRWREPGGRLPTEDEWEASARGPAGLRYPWGDIWVRGHANADSLRDGFAPVGADSLGKSWVGAVGLIGNAWEWTASEALGPRGAPGHVIKGGAFDSPPQTATAAFRTVFPDNRPWLRNTGFRCAQTVAPGPPAGTPPASAAVPYFLRGNYEIAQRTPRAVRRAIEEYETAVRLDPGFTPALARVALGYALLLDWGWEYPGLTSGQVLDRGFAAVDRALRQDSASADAWMARGFLLSLRNPRTFDGVRDAMERAVALNPRNAEAYHHYGMALLWLGRDTEAADMYHRALRLEPERPITLFNLGRVDMRRNRYAQARRWADSALALDPGADYAYVLRALAEFRLGNRVEARADVETAVRLRGGFRVPGEAVLALVELQAADTPAARTRIERLERDVRAAGRPTITDAAWVGRALVALGEPGRALDLLERVRPRGARLWFYLRAPEFDAIRSDPRFQRILEESRPE